MTGIQEKRRARRRRIRSKVKGTSDRPRLSVYKSNKYLYAQIIDDDTGNTIASVSSKDIKGASAQKVGKEIAKLASEAGVKKVVFDRSGYPYTGNVAAIADAAREGGLEF